MNCCRSPDRHWGKNISHEFEMLIDAMCRSSINYVVNNQDKGVKILKALPFGDAFSSVDVLNRIKFPNIAAMFP